MPDYQNDYESLKSADLDEVIGLALENIGSHRAFSEEHYQRALTELRSRPRRAVAAIIGYYESLPYTDYLSRWCHVQLLADLAEPTSLKFLDRLLSRPPRTTPMSVRAQETILATTAVDAIVRIYVAGHAEALRILERQRKNPSLFVRRAAVRSTQRFASGGGSTIPFHPRKTHRASL